MQFDYISTVLKIGDAVKEKTGSIQGVRSVYFTIGVRDKPILTAIEKKLMAGVGTEDPTNISNTEIIREALTGWSENERKKR